MVGVSSLLHLAHHGGAYTYLFMQEGRQKGLIMGSFSIEREAERPRYGPFSIEREAEGSRCAC